MYNSKNIQTRVLPSKPSKEYQGINQTKNEWDSLNMRKPGGLSILDLQKISQKGFLIEPRIPDSYFDQYGFEDKFSPEEIRNFKEAFIFFDREGDGTMATEDLGLALRALGFLVTSQDIKDLLKKLDPENAGSIDLKDFLLAIADVSKRSDSIDIIRQSFAPFDKDGTGLIKISEFKHVMKSIGDPLTEEEVNSFLKDFDLYGDGMIRVDDLIEILMTNVK